MLKKCEAVLCRYVRDPKVDYLLLLTNSCDPGKCLPASLVHATR